MRGAALLALLVLVGAIGALVTLATSTDPDARDAARRSIGATLAAVVALALLVGAALSLVGAL